MQMLYRLSYVGSGAVPGLKVFVREREASRSKGRLSPSGSGRKKDELFPADFRQAKIGGKCFVGQNLRAPGRPVNARLPGRWSGKRDSNPRPSAWKADALPLSYSRTGVLPLLYVAASRAQEVTKVELTHVMAID